jgi:hypothetical protein
MYPAAGRFPGGSSFAYRNFSRSSPVSSKTHIVPIQPVRTRYRVLRRIDGRVPAMQHRLMDLGNAVVVLSHRQCDRQKLAIFWGKTLSGDPVDFNAIGWPGVFKVAAPFQPLQPVF